MALLPVDATIAQLLAAADAWRARALPVPEWLPLTDADGRILARDVVADMAVPPEANSAMDGYALAVESLTGDAPWRLPISQRIPAGQPAQPLVPGTAARIFTGACIPAGADTVVMQENCQTDATDVLVLERPAPGSNIRAAGQDIACGELVASAGTRIGPALLGLLASVGMHRVAVWPSLTVALLCTGDELVEPGQPLAPGQIYNSNRRVVTALLQRLGFTVVDLGMVADTLPATRTALQQAAGLGVDLILSTGGVSVGEEDHVRAAVSELGHLDLWKIAIKPGKPLAFGRVDDVLFIGLPGNPQSVWVTFEVLARPFLRRLQGEQQVLPQFVMLPSGFVRLQPQSRDEYLRVRYDAATGLMPHPNQSSGVLSSAVWADGLVRLAADTTVTMGQLLPFWFVQG